MLEASGFDFRNRYPQKLLMKLVKSCSLDKDVGALAYNISLDLYRTFAPLKQTSQTMALACLELAIRVADVDLADVKSEHGFDYERWAVTRLEVMGKPTRSRSRNGLTQPHFRRNTSRPPGSLHPPPCRHHSWPRLSPRQIHQYPHNTQPGSSRCRVPTLHRMGRRTDRRRKDDRHACCTHSKHPDHHQRQDRHT